MKTIYKRTEPRNLLTYRQQYRDRFRLPISDESKEILDQAFDDMNSYNALKDEVRQALLEDQGFICCYCMCKITAENSRIEHFRCRDRHPELILSYANFYVACNGNHLVPTCDVAKDTTDISLSPGSQGLCERVIVYKFVSGEIGWTDDRYETDIKCTLNLNCTDLIQQRKKAYEGFKKGFIKRHNGEWSIEILRREFDHYLSLDRPENAGKPKNLPAFYGLLLAFLHKEIARRI